MVAQVRDRGGTSTGREQGSQGPGGRKKHRWARRRRGVRRDQKLTQDTMGKIPNFSCLAQYISQTLGKYHQD